jgi:hypothetical protein
LPDLIVNPAAYTPVDRAEDERELVFIVNGEAPGVIARWASRMRSGHAAPELQVRWPGGREVRSFSVAHEIKAPAVSGAFYGADAGARIRRRPRTDPARPRFAGRPAF